MCLAGLKGHDTVAVGLDNPKFRDLKSIATP